MPRQNSVAPKLPTLPQGEQIAVHSTYLDAQKAVEALSDKGFPVQQVTIVGTDLKMVERVTGRLTYPRVAVAGMASGAWFGLFVGLLLTMFSPEGSVYSIVAAIGIGAGFGLLFSVLSFSLTRGKRDFTSSSQIVASSYAVLCERETAGQATQILREANLLGRPAPAQAAHPLASAQPVQPPAYGQSYGAPTPPAAPAAPQAPTAPAPSPSTSPRAENPATASGWSTVSRSTRAARSSRPPADPADADAAGADTAAVRPAAASRRVS